MKWLNGFSLAATFEGEFSSNVTSYAARSKSVRRIGSYGFGGLTSVRLIDWGDIPG
jgi:hypothetical protein